MRAQVAIEFLATATIALIMLVGILYAVLYAQQTANIDAEQAALERVADDLQQEILLAAQVRDGYTRTFSLQAKVINQAYTATQYPDGFSLQSTNAQVTRKTPAYTGVLNLPDITIQKEAGVIVLS